MSNTLACSSSARHSIRKTCRVAPLHAFRLGLAFPPADFGPVDVSQGRSVESAPITYLANPTAAPDQALSTWAGDDAMVHFVWHLFVVAGTACHVIAVLWYAA